jgi:hypothetical protein
LRGNLFVFAFLICSVGFAQVKLDSYVGGANQSFGSSAFNPGNRVLYLKENYGYVELRPEAKATLGKNPIVLRPRVHANLQSAVETSPPGDEASTVDVWLNEGYFVTSPNDDLEISIGRQIYQWGPAEVLNS